MLVKEGSCLQFVKNTSVKHNKAKHNKTSHACILFNCIEFCSGIIWICFQSRYREPFSLRWYALWWTLTNALWGLSTVAMGTWTICEFQKLLHQMLSNSYFSSYGSFLHTCINSVLNQSLMVNSIEISVCSLCAVTSILALRPTNCSYLCLLLNTYFQSPQLC